MSTFSDELIADVKATVESQWSTRNGTVIPETSTVQLGNDRVLLDAVMLYADLADSTELAIKDQREAAEVYKAYLQGVSKLIRRAGGEIRSFDGDRVMGVFIGSSKNSDAARCALQINWFFQKVLVDKFKSYYSNSLGAFSFAQTVGIDAGSIHVARAGVRNNNDLIWVGRAPNLAAKLSATRWTNVTSIITPSVYGALQDKSKVGGTEQKNMWTHYQWDAGKAYGVPTVYGSNWTWKP